MHFPPPPPEALRPFLTWQRILEWAQAHYRYRIFNRDEKVPTRSGLLYLVEQGAIRIVGKALTNTSQLEPDEADEIDETFLGFVGVGQPFELVAQSPFALQAYAHVDRTSVMWLYWHDLDNWPLFRREIFETFRYQHQRKLLWLSTLGKRRTLDRLLGFLTLLIEEYGEPGEGGYCLPYPLTHAQIGSAIGSTRVTVTRLMGQLRRQGLILIKKDNSICLPTPLK